MKRKKEVFTKLPDVRPLDQRESKIDTRKGMNPADELKRPVHIQMKLYGNPFDDLPVVPPVVTTKINPVIITSDDNMEPDYIKKYRSVMK